MEADLQLKGGGGDGRRKGERMRWVAGEKRERGEVEMGEAATPPPTKQQTLTGFLGRRRRRYF